jgi:hypothetical protein
MKTGDRFIVTTGEYSDYGIRDSFVVLKDFSFDLALKRWLSEHGDGGNFGYGHGQSDQDFLASLRADGYVADEKLNKIHLMDYYRSEPDPAKDEVDEPAAAAPTAP